VGDGGANVLLTGERLRKQVDGTAEGRRPDGGGGAWAAIEIHAANPLRGKECPGMVGGRVGVVEGNAVEVDIEIAVREAAEVSLALAQPDTVAADGECAGNDLDDLTVVGDGRGEVLNVGVGDERLGGTLLDKAAAGRGLRSDGIDACVDLDLLRD